MHISKKHVFVLIKRQAGSKMNCNDFQAVLMANKSWIRKLTRTPAPSLSLSLSLSFSLPLVSSLWGSCGSERHFGARLRQYFTLIKRMVGSTVGAAQEHFFSR